MCESEHCLQPHAELLIRKIEWDRIYLYWELSVPTVLSGCSFCLWEPNTKQKIPCEIAAREEEFVRLVLNITNYGNRAPVPNGAFRLCAETGTDLVPAKVDFAVSKAFPSLERVFRYFRRTRALTLTFMLSENDVEPFFVLEVYDMKCVPQTPQPLSVHLRAFPGALKNALKSIDKACISVLFRLFTLLRRRSGNHVLFASNASQLNGNLEAIHSRMLQRGLAQTFSIRVECGVPYGISLRVQPRLIRFLFQAAGSNYIFIDGYYRIFNLISLPKNTKLIQAWHAGCGFKAIGYSRFGFYGSPPLVHVSHRDYTYVLTGSKNIAGHFAEAFGIEKKCILPTGLPRIDAFLDPERRARFTAEFFETYPQCRQKQVILFAPTFRGRGPSDAYYDYQLLDFDRLYEFCGDNAVILFKMHPFVKEPVPVPAAYADRLLVLDSSFYINDLFYVSDLLITDYSSNIYDFSLMRRPMLFFAYDEEVYSTTRGFHRPYEETAPGKICRSFEELLTALQNKDYETEKLDAFLPHHFDYIDQGASDRAIDWILLGKMPAEYR